MRTQKEIREEVSKVNTFIKKFDKYHLSLLIMYRDGLLFALGENETLEE